jgi:hypothetical protein
MSSLDSRRRQLRQLYGFDFPDDLWRFWDFVRRLQPLDPLHALADTLQVVLVGPFDVLAGRFDGLTPRYSHLLHWRYHDDPPEFFTVLAGDTDGLHWGYYLDDPAQPRSPAAAVASYYAGDVFELSLDGDNLFEAIRLQLEYLQRDNEDYRAEDKEQAPLYDQRLEQLARLRERLVRYATGERTEVGEEYTERYAGSWTRSEWVVAPTREGMGIVVPEEKYRPLSLVGPKLWRFLRRHKNPVELVEEARQALSEGFPGTALELGKDLWGMIGARRRGYAYELLDAAYEALGRQALRTVLAVHRANRRLPSVDILDLEFGS